MDWARTSSRQQGQFRESKIGPQITKKHQHFKWREQIPISYWIVFWLQVYRGRRKVYRKKNRHSKKKASLLFLSYTSDERPNGDHACRKEPRTSPWKTEKCTEDTFLLRSGGKFGDSCEKKDDSQSDILNQNKEQFRREHRHNRLKIGTQHNELWATINELTERFLRSRRKWQNVLRREGFKQRWKLSPNKMDINPDPWVKRRRKSSLNSDLFRFLPIKKSVLGKIDANDVTGLKKKECHSELRSLDDVKLQGQEKLSRDNACKHREARDHGEAKDVLTSASKQVLQKQKYSTILEQCEDDETQRQKMTGHIE